MGEPLIGRLLRYDALSATYSTLTFGIDEDRSPTPPFAPQSVANVGRSVSEPVMSATL